MVNVPALDAAGGGLLPGRHACLGRGRGTAPLRRRDGSPRRSRRVRRAAPTRAGRELRVLTTVMKDAVYRQLIRTCGNEEDAEDALVEALLKAYQNLDRLRERTAFRAWLAQIERRVCWHLKAREALAPVMQLSALEAQGVQPVDTAPPPDVMLARAFAGSVTAHRRPPRRWPPVCLCAPRHRGPFGAGGRRAPRHHLGRPEVALAPRAGPDACVPGREAVDLMAPSSSVLAVSRRSARAVTVLQAFTGTGPT